MAEKSQLAEQTHAYNAEYYENYRDFPYDRNQPHWLAFFGKVAEEISRTIRPRRVLDVGCAKGFLVECLRDRGVQAFGVDISEYAISEARPDIHEYCRVASATDPIQGQYDLITCIEVLEHLSEAEAQQAARNMASHAESILFSSTPKDDRDEPTHQNVRPIIYWLNLFRELGLSPDLSLDVSYLSRQAILFRKSEPRLSDDQLNTYALTHNQAIELHEKELAIQQLQNHLQQQRAEIQDVRTQLQNMSAAWEAAEHDRQALTSTLAGVGESFGWRLVIGFRQGREKLLPAGSRRRRVCDKLQHSAKLLFMHGARRAVQEAIAPVSMDPYSHWIQANEPKQQELARQRELARKFHYQPLISILTPVYNTDPHFLEKCIESVRGQTYSQWELCICDDGSTTPQVRELLSKYSQIDRRIKLSLLERNQGISLASNEALNMAAGEYVALLDHDDELSPEALFQAVSLLQEHPTADMIYSDEDKLGPAGNRLEPFFKPDWSPEYFLSCMYTCHLGVYRRELLNKIGGFRQGFEGSQDYDVVLRLTEHTNRIHHIPKILYHWRKAPGSAAAAVDAKPYSYSASERALAEHVRRRGLHAEVLPGKWPQQFRVKHQVDTSDRVSIIIPTRDKLQVLKNCVDSIREKTSYPNYEIVIVDNDSSDPAALEYLSKLPHQVLRFSEAFNFSRINNFGVKHTSAKYILFLNNDVQVISPDWIEAMLEFAQQPEIGIVGAKLLFPNNTIQHIGVVLGIRGVAGHHLTGYPANSPAHAGLSGPIRNFSAVTAACMMMRREVFELVGGFDERLTVAFNDVDLCLRVREKGFRIVWTPYAELYHHESATRGYSMDAAEIQFMKTRWGKILLHDPYYNPNLTLERADFSLRI